ncbi:focadhesin isoform X2 [Agrilus planipennis]|uniref:Focadhesin isoform X2 n=1 Tax=Agrilus planipennis TaxID=224129 RepID=A0A7F5QY58_AGRPL|nr:focadhesin isoform X2 [Agrilus planipennis]
MNEIEERLASDNPAYICTLFSKLVSVIEKKQDEVVTNENRQLELLQFLERKCIDKNSLVALTAARALLKLVQDGIVDKNKVLLDLTSTIVATESYSGLCYLLNEMLVIKMVQNEGIYYNLWSPQHPLVSVMNQHFKSSVEIFYNIENTCVINQRSYITKLYWPIYYYLFCNPESQLNTPILYKYWNLLLKETDNEHMNLMFNIVSWMQFHNSNRLLIIIDFLLQCLEVHIIDKSTYIVEALAVFLSSLLHDVIKLGLNPISIIRSLQKTLNFLMHSSSSNLIVLLISSSLIDCPVNYLTDLLILCEMLLKSADINELSLRCLQISLFNWMVFKSDLLEMKYIKRMIIRIEKITEQINNGTKKDNLTFNCLVKKLKSNQYNLHIAFELYTLCNYLNADVFIFWLARFSSNMNEVLSKNLFIFLCGMILFKSLNENAINELLQLLIHLVKKHNCYSTLLLTAVLYKLSCTKNPEMHFILLKTFPHLIICKENVPFIFHTLESLRSSTIPVRTFIMKLHFDIWNLDPKYYINLQNLLTEKIHKISLDEDLEVNVVKSKILREICIKRPELYGGELVSFLSEVLNKYRHKNGSLPSSLALEGISALCKAGIVDIFSTLKELFPKFRSDTRDRVLISFCNLVSTVPDYFEESERCVSLSQEVTTLLWEFATQSGDKNVRRSAYEGLSNFKIEDISDTMPERYKICTNDVLPAFGLVNCECWINILKSSPEDTLDAIGTMLFRLIEIEIIEFRPRIYQVPEGGREPDTYNYLSVYSPLRAITNYVKLNVQKMKLNAAYLQCLRVLSLEYKKPLPPLDWCFLQELVHYKQAKFFCICIASHQVRSSGSARRFMENIVVALTTNEHECLDVFQNLRFLCDSIQPAILRPFIKNALTYSLKLYDEDEHFFNTINTCLKSTLSRHDIHEANRATISDVLVYVIKNADQKSPSFESILKTTAELSKNYVSKFNLDRTSIWKFLLFVKVRIAKALYSKENHFSWLNEIFNVEDYTQGEQIVILQEVVKVIKKYKNDPSVRVWILELLGQTQALIVDNGSTEKRLNFLCSTIVISFIFLTDQDILILNPLEIIKDSNMALTLFPSSVYGAVKTNLWQEYVPQLLEWLYNMSNCKFIMFSYQTTFYQTLSALRHEKAFGRKLYWLKYMDRKMDIIS